MKQRFITLVQRGLNEQPSGISVRRGIDPSICVRRSTSCHQQLPSGFQQRLSLARCYAKDSSILLLDEPGQTLDEAGDADFMAYLEKLKGQKTVVMITHRPSHMRLADRLLVIEEGRVAMDGPPDLVLQQMPRGAL